MPHPYYDLLSNKLFKRLIKGRPFLFFIRLFFVVIFFVLIYIGLFGGIYRNISSAITGIVWLMLISLFVITFGKVWCTVCPWNTVADWLRLKLRTITGTFPDASQHETFAFSLSLQWPHLLRNLWLPVLFLALLVFIEYSVGITHNPRITAYVALAILGMAIISGLLFTRKSFCRYGCPVGIMSGLYALFAGIELRSIDKDVCTRCPTKDCIRGNTHGIGCPVSEFPAEMELNSHCILCTECIKTCPYDNIGINVRPFGKDLNKIITAPAPQAMKERKSELLLIIILTLFSIFHNFYTSLIGANFNELLVNNLGLDQFKIAGSFVITILILSVVIFYIFAPYARYFYAFLPLQMLSHLGMTIKQFSQNIDLITSSLNDPFGRNWNLMGITDTTPMLFSANTIWYIEIGLVFIGVIFGTYFILFKIRHLRSISYNTQTPDQVKKSSGIAEITIGLAILFALAALNLWLSLPN